MEEIIKKGGEVRVTVKPVDVTYICDECGLGFMEYTGRIKPVSPPWFVHRCNKCKHEEWFHVKYPRTENVPI